MAWDEWERLKAAAAETQPARMQINGLPPEDRPTAGSRQGDLAADQTDLAAIGDKAFTLYNRLWKEARVAIPATDKTAGNLTTQGYDLGSALQHVSNRWDRQLKSLMDACAHISNHMDFTKNAHKGDEIYIERQLSSIETLDQGFDESYAPPGPKNEAAYGNKEKKS
ncbi:hypothetical protein ACISU4_15820 [Streptomyces wuyuanensis]|uniref:hypothetical protein n=1 Tax=Streptomyces wuyuanensis TaxID=1196353 RepID=UPI003810B8D1